MNLTRMLFMLLSPAIQNSKLPVCKNCIHFLPYNVKTPEEDYNLGKCAMYGKKDILSGIIANEYAQHVRHNIFQCGKGGYQYEEKAKK